MLQGLTAAQPSGRRKARWKKLGAAWDWVQRNGVPCDMVGRGVMLALRRAGHVELPPARLVPPNPLAVRRPPAAPPADLDRTPIRSPLAALRPLTFRQVRRTPEEPLFNSLIEAYHYLGYTQPAGAHPKYLVSAQDGRPPAARAWASAPPHPGARRSRGRRKGKFPLG